MVKRHFNGILDTFRSRNNFDVKNPLEVKERLGDLEHVMVSYDVVLFSNTPTKAVMGIINENWSDISKYLYIKSKAMCMEGLDLCTNNGSFKYDGSISKQLFGVSMGSCLSVSFSGIYLNHVLNKVMEETGIQPFLLVYLGCFICFSNCNVKEKMIKIKFCLCCCFLFAQVWGYLN